MSAVTLVSMYPFTFVEVKPGMVPCYYTIPGVEEGDFNFQVYDDVIDKIYLDSDRGKFTVKIPALDLVTSLVDDFCKSHISVGPGRGPGLFCLDWHYENHHTEYELNEEDIVTRTKKVIKQKYADRLSEARARQSSWYAELIKTADNDWAQYHSHRTITNIQRHAAKVMGLQRDWTMEQTSLTVKKCVFCRSIIDHEAVLCPSCHEVADITRYNQLKSTIAS